MDINGIWGVILIAIVALWVAVQTSPELQEQTEECRATIREWWCAHSYFDDLDDEDQEREEDKEWTEDLVDDNWSRHARGVRKLKLPEQAVAHPTDADSYFLDQHEYAA